MKVYYMKNIIQRERSFVHFIPIYKHLFNTCYITVRLQVYELISLSGGGGGVAVVLGQEATVQNYFN